MKVLIVLAHPEPRSLNASLKNAAAGILQRHGHEVAITDLYRQQWEASAGRQDFPALPADERLIYSAVSKKAYLDNEQSPDISTEQEKIKWADVILLQFPLWWFGMPAILKGWIDRTFTNGFGYGTGGRYGNGTLKGKKVMLMITTGATAEQLGPHGIHGAIEDLMFPVHHGVFWYAGAASLPPFVVNSANQVSPERYATILQDLEQRLLSIPDTAPIRYRVGKQDYDEKEVLQPHFVTGKSGFALHLADE
ncbi:NAD(P)H-dependent oxidoreductase [Chitinophaga oryzae]|uniref:NAD(P)H-dependent oxidoreductase n=1 Tax=Chitinophaga oryzae TaxID=2725414 RepID=A0AAE6ZCR3_9BACT|nr:NAD(P)H-dependent oxidoreductase [Chitinophaga oryzae]QJB29795.1 NAD(P)H-dependent oxidoreductase [Chitinophaga oryzae]